MAAHDFGFRLVLNCTDAFSVPGLFTWHVFLNSIPHLGVCPQCPQSKCHENSPQIRSKLCRITLIILRRAWQTRAKRLHSLFRFPDLTFSNNRGKTEWESGKEKPLSGPSAHFRAPHWVSWRVKFCVCCVDVTWGVTPFIFIFTLSCIVPSPLPRRHSYFYSLCNENVKRKQHFLVYCGPVADGGE